LHLQRLVRGRAVQNAYYQGMVKAKALIRELRCDEQSPGESVADATKAAALKQERLVDTAVDSMQGEVLSSALDFISKEIIRVREERQIAITVKEAARIRRVREAEESGRRQAETTLRLARDAVGGASAPHALVTMFVCVLCFVAP
jgi:hypothetical protein